jgi:hypothetical protein
MALELTVKKIQLWVNIGADRKGFLADSLEKLAEAGADLEVVMAYRFPEELDRAAVEVFPIDGKTAEAAARKVGFELSKTPCLWVEGEDHRGLGARMARAIADAGVSMTFHMAQRVGRKFAAAIGFASEDDLLTARKAIEGLARRG